MENFNVLDKMTEFGTEQIIFHHERTLNSKCIFFIHDTSLGPIVGHCRPYDYINNHKNLEDNMRLAKIITDEFSISRTRFGGE